MNYRQWKKNYKKKHGYNPPVSEDKRKRNRQLVRKFPVFFDEFMPTFLNTLADACEILRDAVECTKERILEIRQQLL